jgi:hypothetical protein
MALDSIMGLTFFRLSNSASNLPSPTGNHNSNSPTIDNILNAKNEAENSS